MAPQQSLCRSNNGANMSPTAQAAAGQASMSATSSTLASSNLRPSAVESEQLSDPEGGDDWSDEDVDDEERSEMESQSDKSRLSHVQDSETQDKAAPPLSGKADEASRRQLPDTSMNGREVELGRSSNMSRVASPQAAIVSATSRRDRLEALTSPTDSREALVVESNSASRYTGGDRRRAISSSSAFGSRARVKQYNMQRRHRPLSFQQAIESLLGPSADITLSHPRMVAGQGPARRSKGKAEVNTVPTMGSVERIATPSSERGLLAVTDHSSDVLLSQNNSAPADFSRPQSPLATDKAVEMPIQTMHHTIDKGNRLSARAEGPSRESAASFQACKQQKGQSKFFIGGASLGDNEHEPAAENEKAQEAPKGARGKDMQHDSGNMDHLANRSSSKPSGEGSQSSHQHARHQPHFSHHHQHQHHRPHQHSHARFHALLPASTAGRSRSGVALNKRAHHGAPHHARFTDSEQDADSKADAKSSNDGLSRPEATPESNRMDTAEKAGSPVWKGAGRPPVKFHMGSLGSEEGSEEGSIQSQSRRSEARLLKKPTGLPSTSDRDPDVPKKAEVATENSDEWASDTSEDSEEERAQKAKARRKKETERQDAMFKKIPIRSKSAADVRYMMTPGDDVADRDTSNEDHSAAPAVRGILSSIFHPEDTALARRSHGSAADLRQDVPAATQAIKKPRKTSHDEASTSIHGKGIGTNPRPPSMTHVGSFGGSGLKMSKSAVALPVLSTTGSRSTPHVAHMSRAEAQRSEPSASQNAAVFDSEDEEGDADGVSSSQGGVVDRLNEIASTRQSKKAQHRRQQQRERQSKAKKRGSNSSLEVHVAPDMDEEEIRRHRRSASPAAAELPRRSQSAVNVPEAGLPQSPRTTRRNMLRDELSESLRQNLLWERKSRNRMLGIGASGQGSAAAPRPPSAAPDTPVATVRGHFPDAEQNHHQRSSAMGPPSALPPSVALANRNHNHHPSVLGGNALRPLTSRSSSGNTDGVRATSSSQGQQQRRAADETRRQYTGDFHHTGW